MQRAAREVGERLLDRVGMVGLLVVSAALVALDFIPEVASTLSIGFTVAETVLVVPWAFAVLHFDRRGPRRPTQRGSGGRSLLIHGLTLLLLCACLWQKWLLVFAAQAGEGVSLSQYRFFTLAAYVLATLGLLGHGRRVGAFLLTLSRHPARLTALSFGLTGLLGALVLSFPQAQRAGGSEAFVDALFTAFSAVCVTGLVVQDTPVAYSGFGQAVILGLVQVGGLGIMVMYAALAVLSGRRLRAGSAAMLADLLDADSVAALRRTTLSIIAYTLAFELLGAAALYMLFRDQPDIASAAQPGLPMSGAGGPLWAAVFHSVSAFCNAGFTVFLGGAEPFTGDLGVCATLMLLIVLGGLGFPVLRELGEQLATRLRGVRARRLSLHARCALVTTGVLTLAGVLLVLVGEWGGTLAGLDFGERLLAALFQSVTARTAGFNTLPIGALSGATALGMCILMVIGASPGSTGGGVKTTTVAVLFATFRAELRSAPAVSLLDRSLGRDLVRQATGVVFLSGAILTGMLLLLLLVESAPPFELLFEAVSAFGTVGLSTGVTPRLSTAGKLVIIATMFMGRIGPMTLALALAGRARMHRARFAEESVRIG